VKGDQTLNGNCVVPYVVDDPNIAIMAVDSKSRLVYVNGTYLRVMGFKREEIIGRHIEDIVPMTKTTQVLKTGKAEKAYFIPLNGQNTIATCHPVIKEGNIIGVIGRSLFLDMDDAHLVTAMVNKLDDDVRLFREREKHIEQKNNGFSRLIGQNISFKKIKKLAKAISGTDSTVLLTGETGTGKDLFAKAIHLSSPRRQGPFIRVNCAAIPEQLLESELFGYEEGTFTGAIKGGKKGKFEMADHGTIFLDEIGEMPLSMQAKLLVVLQEKEIEPLGSQSQRSKKIDVRIIAATNQKLDEMVIEGRFRQDLYYRLNVINIEIPALRHRKSDIPMLAESIVEKVCHRMETVKYTIDSEVIRVLQNYDWPGNVRELENVLERAIIRAAMEGSTSIQVEHTGELLRKNVLPPLELAPSCQTTDLKNYLQTHEKLMLEEVLHKTRGDKYLASEMLNIHLSALYKKMNKYGLSQKAYS
jgi:transcriptional regulator with PAS, ATPase and Fis domain